MTLLNDQYAPITSTLGFIEAPLTEVSEALAEWRTRLYGSVQVDRYPGGLEENILRLEPLTAGVITRQLLVATSNPTWTAFFDCGDQGSDPVGPVSVLAQTLACRGVIVASVPPKPSNSSAKPLGALQFQLYGPVPNPILNNVRSITLWQDGGRWHIENGDEPFLDFENIEAYSNRKVRDRFTLEMLKDYSAALGLHPFDPAFYPGPSVLVTNTGAWSTSDEEFTLAEVREQLDLNN